MASGLNINGTSHAALVADQLSYTLTDSPRLVPNETMIKESNETICSDHMIVASWKEPTGWSAPKLKPYGPLSLMPTASCLHYATECFEGLKAYRGFDGRLRVFRLERNAARLLMSAERISLPQFDPLQVKKMILALLSVDAARWLPKDRAGSFLYIRPTIIGTQAQLGVQKPNEAMLFIVASFMPKLDDAKGGLRLQTSPGDSIRAWVGGFGNAKIGANYGPSVLPLQEAVTQGFQQILWLYGEHGECTEAGGSNFFVVWKRKDGRTELITAPLDDKIILDGITRKSCLELAKERLADELDIVERKYTISELIDADADGRLLECFVAGTAWFISAVSQIRHRGRDVYPSMGLDGNGGEITNKIKGWLTDIMYGNVEHDWAEVVPENQNSVA
ncbi:hypothetical protein EsH8_VI_000065 [Colletotrichum jinshuiense]